MKSMADQWHPFEIVTAKTLRRRRARGGTRGRRGAIQVPTHDFIADEIRYQKLLGEARLAFANGHKCWPPIEPEPDSSPNPSYN